jgi:hypothetical protein
VKVNHDNLGFVRIGNQPPVTPLTLNRISKWVEKALRTNQYEPFIKVKRTPTVGKGRKVENPDSDSSHELLSILEGRLLRYLDFLSNVVAIKTQYPLLPITATLEVAEEMGVKHPSFGPKGKNIRQVLKINQACVMTSDYLIDYVDEFGVLHQCAIALKAVNEDGKFSDKEKRDANIKNKLDIESEYWRRDEGEWRLFTSAKLFNQEHFARNLLEADTRRRQFLPEVVMQEVEASFNRWFKNAPLTSFSPLMINIAHELDTSIGTVRTAFWKLIWQQRLPVDISREIIFNRPLSLGGEKWIWR